MIKKIYQIKAFVKHYFLLKEFEYALDVYERIYCEELKTDLDFLKKKIIALETELIDKELNPVEDKKFKEMFEYHTKSFNIQQKVKKDKEAITEIKNKIEIIKNDLF